MHSRRITEKVKDDYDTIAKEFSDTRRFPWADFDLFDKYYKKNSSVLDLGCGNGRLLEYLKKKGFKEYLGVDQSKELIKLAKKKYKNNRFKVLNINELKNLDGKFDALFAIASFHHLPPNEQLSALKIWATHMNDGAILFMTNWNLHQPKYLPLLLRSLIRPSFGFRGVLVPWKNKLDRYYFAFTKHRLKKLLKKAGYKVLFHDYVRDGKHANLFSGKNILTIARYEKP